jgi:ATP-dependent DNA helicase RecQ
VAKLTYSEEPIWPDDTQICADLNELKLAAEAKGLTPLSLDTQCQFLAGLTQPILTRLQARRLQGFGRLEKCRYADIKQKLEKAGT